jgi:hypothetical protein
MVRADPHHAQLGHLSGLHILFEILRPDVDAELIGNVQVGLRIVLDGAVGEIRKRRMGANRVVVLELFLGSGLICLRVGVELAPGRMATAAKCCATYSRNRGATRNCEGVVLDIFPVVLYTLKAGEPLNLQLWCKTPSFSFLPRPAAKRT